MSHPLHRELKPLVPGPTALSCWRPAPTCPGSRPGHSDASRCRLGALSSHQTDSQLILKAKGHSFLLRSCPWCGVALLPCAQGQMLSGPHRKDRQKGKETGSTFVITTVQLAHCCPPCLQTEATPPPARGANIFRDLHLYLPRSLEEGSHRQPLTGQLPLLYLTGAFRKKTLKSHQSPCQDEPPGPPALLSLLCQ